MKSKAMKAKAKMRINTLKDVEETEIRLRLKEYGSDHFNLKMLANFRSDASLRQINNTRKASVNR